MLLGAMSQPKETRIAPSRLLSRRTPPGNQGRMCSQNQCAWAQITLNPLSQLGAERDPTVVPWAKMSCKLALHAQHRFIQQAACRIQFLQLTAHPLEGTIPLGSIAMTCNGRRYRCMHKRAQLVTLAAMPHSGCRPHGYAHQLLAAT